MKIIDKFNRGDLAEGRDFGIGFAIIEKKEKSYNTIQAFTTCKDYFNDIVFSEIHNIKLKEVYGFKHIISGIFKNKKSFFMGVNALHFNNSDKEWENRSIAEKKLISNSSNLIMAINKIEELLKIEGRTLIEFSNTNTLILEAPIDWARQPFMLSLYLLIIRCFFNVTATNVALDTNTMVTTQQSNTFIPADKYMIKPLLEFMKLDMVKVKLEIHPKATVLDANNIHNAGIKSFIDLINNNNDLKKKLC